MTDDRHGETIFAPSTAPGRAGVAVVRISGPNAGKTLAALTGGDLPAARQAALRRLCDPRSGAGIDRALVLWFPAPRSFTGEDVAELHLHGGRAVIAAVLASLGALPGLRPAEAGEFTRRAFDHDKLDLTAVEGLADLIEAETEAQRRQALRQMEGGLARRIDDWVARLSRFLAHFEAAIDFSDEDLPESLDRNALAAAAGVASEIAAALSDDRRGERLRDGLTAVILGAPNAGKSSLLNRLAQREAAIVSALAGTTRDVIEVHLDLGGYPLTLVDTAGLREAAAALVAADGREAQGVAEPGHWAIEREGMARAQARATAADITLLVVDLANEPRLSAELLGHADARSLVVLNKSDQVSEAQVDAARHTVESQLPDLGAGCFVVSAREGSGLEALLVALVRRAADYFDRGTADAEITRARHRAALEDCRAALERAAVAGLPELIAEELRLAVRALGRITGRVDVEDLLDIVFSEFCIGK